MKDTKERRHEIKKVLLNNLVLTEDKKLAPGPDIRVTLWGIGDGAGETFFFGVKKKVYEMISDYSNNTQAIYRAAEQMKDVGRMLSLETVDSGACVLVRHIFFRPVVLVLEENALEDTPEENIDNNGENKELILSAYCGRAILSGVSMRHAINQVEKIFGGKIKRYIATKEME
ncbi:MAG: hypothetical protein E7272_03625 [Pseudobutyrivibrio ruminis]|uniref:Uncharacterized protein n=1 Tax=Pseudobutyrivibrio ruminis TaxID=46206 RepID=A0A927U9S5_9FIRM|nr:hypothetical protein [Pseudobutyrivibrio ruminis]